MREVKGIGLRTNGVKSNVGRSEDQRRMCRRLLGLGFCKWVSASVEVCSSPEKTIGCELVLERTLGEKNLELEEDLRNGNEKLSARSIKDLDNQQMKELIVNEGGSKENSMEKEKDLTKDGRERGDAFTASEVEEDKNEEFNIAVEEK
ncbi:Uncharacterized protein TCM_043290 [Theobroma cacao]|uniref:Uncharacterized protein n=1 Tax=Theobroma cacao TaxID=3641 RepID=A0A061FP11_THECC|nr:Uncharacterized protein TCM_043290 [Theobroma cacao]